MFYVKAQLSDQVEIKVDLYEEEIFTQCPDCGVELEVASQALIAILEDEAADFSSTSICCEYCSSLRIVKMKEGNK